MTYLYHTTSPHLQAYNAIATQARLFHERSPEFKLLVFALLYGGHHD